MRHKGIDSPSGIGLAKTKGMSDRNKQQKNSGDSIKQGGLHVLPPEITAEVYHRARPAVATSGNSPGRQTEEYGLADRQSSDGGLAQAGGPFKPSFGLSGAVPHDRFPLAETGQTT